MFVINGLSLNSSSITAAFIEDGVSRLLETKLARDSLFDISSLS
jgi:hypothetical protein